MIISDLDYLESIPETDAMHLNGGAARANSEFLAYGDGEVSNISTIVQNRAISDFGHDFASSFVTVTATGFEGDYVVNSTSSASAGG